MGFLSTPTDEPQAVEDSAQVDVEVVEAPGKSMGRPGATDPTEVIEKYAAAGYSLRETIESQGITKWLVFERSRS